MNSPYIDTLAHTLSRMIQRLVDGEIAIVIYTGIANETRIGIIEKSREEKTS